MTTKHTDVVVVGDGPAGSALAQGCARRGIETALIGAGQPWTATYGCWVDDLEPAAGDLGPVADLFAVTMSDLAVVPLGTNGAISIWNSSVKALHLIVDVDGYVLGGSGAEGGTTTASSVVITK